MRLPGVPIGPMRFEAQVQEPGHREQQGFRFSKSWPLALSMRSRPIRTEPSPQYLHGCRMSSMTWSLVRIGLPRPFLRSWARAPYQTTWSRVLRAFDRCFGFQVPAIRFRFLPAANSGPTQPFRFLTLTRCFGWTVRPSRRRQRGAQSSCRWACREPRRRPIRRPSSPTS